MANSDKRKLNRRDLFSKTTLALAVLVPGKSEAAESCIPAPDHSIPQSGFHGKSENRLDWSGDPRSGRVVFVAHCMLNQNARIVNAADFPAMFEPLVDYLQKMQVGIVQLPCPELYCLGLGRRAVRPGLENPAGMKRLNRLNEDIVFTIKEYLFQGFEVVGILGKNGSPACGVTRTWLDNRQQDGQGIFIRELKQRLVDEKLDIAVLGVADHKQDEAIEWLEDRLK